MIVVDRPENLVQLSPGLGDVGTFKIKESAKAFRILSSSLYSNKIRAIVRELTCNALDSHVEAGNLDPYVVHLPTYTEPTFSVQDFGVGLTHDRVMALYSTYFESTKTESNDFVGALGLGSKSPFSYTDNFVVIASKDGETNTYSAFINDAGVPSIVRLGTEQTGAPNGVTVQMAVQGKDFDTFKRELMDVVRWYDRLPKVNGAYPGKVPYRAFNPFTTPFDSGVESASVTGNGYNRVSAVLMGGIAYPIDASRAEFAKYDKLLREELILKAAIGDVEFQPSREGLTYSPTTVKFIVDKLDALDQKIQKNILAEVDTYPAIWDKVVFLLKQRNELLKKASTDLIKAQGWDKLAIGGLMDPSIKMIRRFSKNGNKVFVSNRKPITVTNLLELANGKNGFYYADDATFKIGDIAGNGYDVPYANIYVFFPEKTGFNAKTFSEKNLFGATVAPLSKSFKTTKKVAKVKSTFYSIVEVEVGRGYSKKTRTALQKVDRLPANAKYFYFIKQGKIDADDVTVKNLTIMNGNAVSMLTRAGLLHLGVGITRSNEKIAKAVGLTSIWDALEADVEKGLLIDDLGFEALVRSYIRNNYGYSGGVMSKPDIVQTRLNEVLDPVLRNAWESTPHSKDPSSHWLFTSGTKYLNDVKNSAGLSVTKAAEKVRSTVSKYSVINLSSAKDEETAIKLINFVFENL
jgi:hypothetical protein